MTAQGVEGGHRADIEVEVEGEVESGWVEEEESVGVVGIRGGGLSREETREGRRCRDMRKMTVCVGT